MTKKIDFHIHTVSSIKDSGVVFSLEWLKKYVEATELDAIAITNHDLFDKKNFEEITVALDEVKVYPGIELALDVGHVNIVFPVTCIDELSVFSDWLFQIHQTQSDSITSEQLCEQLPCWNQGIYIFELGKSKGIKKIPSVLSSVVHVGGVPNQLRFNVAHNNPDSLIPCLFSDAHATDNDTDDRNDIQKLQNKQTYLQVDSCELEDIKRCLRDRSKISVNKDNLQDVININGVNISSGLNLVVGKRGTGKTHFLEKIKEEYSEDKYYEIKQFETARADEYIEKQRKEQSLMALHSWQEKYKTQFLKVKDYLNNDETEQENIGGFLNDVKKFANEMARSQSSQKYLLFQETEYELSNIEFIKNALVNIKEVIEKDEIWGLLLNSIKKKNNFIDVYSELRERYLKFKQENEIKKKVNEVMVEVKTTLTARTGISNVQKCSINKVIHRQQLEKKINEFLKGIVAETSLKNERLLDSDGIPASGGQAVGFALMLRLNEAKNNPIILIDEPESSLDNAYIKNELNKELKQLARNSMVVVITHNSTLGTLLEPDYLIITLKDNNGNYSIMSGEFSSSKIKDSINGLEEKSHDKFIEAMESGMDSYTKKGEIYTNLNN
ncbi:hypothetical protein D3X11_05860 [Streptococcus sp. X16XC17]|uniref:hypothetical protein n=1 Tax=unclassified Streptococcus TaxID=2608887 RepID=UPI00066FE673|nr:MULTISPECIES: hypothetical protein [unclassified Streptococcus]TCD45744.1 hypothetical protein D3X11_05860 [Streptococcus sp. X16XC17]